MVKLNKSIATRTGLLTAIATEKEGIEIFLLILQGTDGINKILASAFSERKILNEAYIALR